MRGSFQFGLCLGLQLSTRGVDRGSENRLKTIDVYGLFALRLSYVCVLCECGALEVGERI